jgi:hypothetical protein
MPITLGLGWWRKRLSRIGKDLLLLLALGNGAYIKMLIEGDD